MNFPNAIPMEYVKFVPKERKCSCDVHPSQDMLACRYGPNYGPTFLICWTCHKVTLMPITGEPTEVEPI